MARFLLIFLAASTVFAAAIYSIVQMQGVDLLSPQVRTIGLAALATALYAGLRVAMFTNKFLSRRNDEDPGAPRRPSAFRQWGRSASLDARLEARRQRVEAAKARQAEKTGESN